MSQSFQNLTFEDIQQILNDTASKGRKVKNGLLFIDASYLYNFYVKDIPFIKRYNLHLRYCQADVTILEEQELTDTKEYQQAIIINQKYLHEWQRWLEIWYDGGSVHGIKPIKIVRKFDRIVNEGLELVAKMLLGQVGTIFKYHALGEGDADEALPSDTQLVDQISRIDVTKAADGGSLSREGSTIYIVGMHPASLASASITETGVFNHSDPTKDLMLDHTVFPTPIDHDQFEDSAGSTTIIYMCGV